MLLIQQALNDFFYMLLYRKGGIFMAETVKNKCLQFFALILSFLTIFTVNSACYLGLGQEEPDSLKRFKK